MKTMGKDDYLLIEMKSKYFQDKDIFMQKCFTQNKYSISILYYLQGLVNSTECVHNWNRIWETRSLHFLKFRKHYKTEFRISAEKWATWIAVSVLSMTTFTEHVFYFTMLYKRHG